MTLLGTSLTAIVDLIDKKKVSPKEIFSYFLTRIEKYNSHLNAYLTVNETSRDENSTKGILYGVPLAIKDNFCTKGIRTTASAKVLDTFIPPYDATIVDRLKKKGALILGKTNMDAWAHGSSTETSDYGPTKNPHDITRSPGGSSGGSAAAVVSYLAPASIGSETAGSIRQPSSWCGIIGLKPTYGRVSRYGLIAMGSSLDCPGPITRTVQDAALLLTVLAGRDPRDGTTSATKPTNYVSELSRKRTYTIGIADEYFEGVDDEISQKINEVIKLLQKMGHTIKKINLMNPQYSLSVYMIIQRAEVASNLSRFDGIRYGKTREYFGAEAKRRIMFGTYTLSHGYYDAYYKKAVSVREMIRDDFKKTFEEVDLIISPTTPCTALPLGEFAKYPFFGEKMDLLNEPSSIAGLPGISVPIGFDTHKLPIGMQFVGRAFDETSLLNIAYQLEQKTGFFGVIQSLLSKYPDS